MDTIPAKNIIFRAKRPESWFGAEYNMNIYRGCSHGCIYCDSRSDCYGIEDFDTVRAKENALLLVRDDLSRKVKRGVVASGAMSDPYNACEKEQELTRHALELISVYRFGAAIATKSPLVARDADILGEIAEHSSVIVKITITTEDDALSKIIEPNTAMSSTRFDALSKLSEAGIFCGVLLMPVLPFILDTDENILGILRKAKESGARFVYPTFGMSLRSGQREYFYNCLDESFPGLRQKYEARYGGRYICSSPRVMALWEVFRSECERLGLLYEMRDIISASRAGRKMEQMSLF